MTTAFFYENSQLSVATVDGAARKILEEHHDEGTPKVIFLAPGKIVNIKFFEIRCMPTVDDEKPSRVRLRFFALSPTTKETFATGWVPLPTMKSLAVTSGQDQKGPLFFFSGGP